MRIFSSGVYLRLVAALTVLTNRTWPLLCVHQQPLFYLFLFGTSLAPLSEVLYLIQGADPTFKSLGFFYLLRCPIFADDLQ